MFKLGAIPKNRTTLKVLSKKGKMDVRLKKNHLKTLKNKSFYT